MRNLSFVFWMLGFPLVCSIGKYLTRAEYHEYSVEVRGVSSLIVLAIWFFVGKLLYEEKEK